MRERNPQEVDHSDDGGLAQALFRATSQPGHVIKIDTRTPDAVESGLSPQEWRELNA